MAASALYRFPSAVASFSFPTDVKSLTIPSHYCNFFRPISVSGLRTPSIRASNYRLKFSGSTAVVSRRAFKLRAVVDGDSATGPEPESDNSEAGASIDLKLPRRSMLVEFTCNLCGERTRRLVNRLAYERGVIFVQCAGCLQHHKLVDNLGLITEYDFRGKTNTDSEIDQV
ncbi:uncharacterized protein C24H6.02c [Neltuma alba]|uniref:uncharacterized protein C24H6.02c n=1 Tax=Neltuma alba TaxID=207710 RepID=UPI0010A2B885|nr:uncharacterized protein C24H6.02c [Prosopis alba]